MARGQHKYEFREEVKYYITLLHRVHGHKEAKNFLTMDVSIYHENDKKKTNRLGYNNQR